MAGVALILTTKLNPRPARDAILSPVAKLVGVGLVLKVLLSGHLFCPLQRSASVFVLDLEAESLPRGLLLFA